MERVRELVLRARAGDREAFGDLVRSYEMMAFRVAMGILRDERDAEEAAQDAFLRAYKAFERFDTERPFGPWIARITANLALNRRRSRRTDVPIDEAAGLAEAGPGPEAAACAERDRAEIRQGLDRLSAGDREVLALRYEAGLAVGGIAQALGVGLSAAKVRLFRARQRLMELLRGRAVR